MMPLRRSRSHGVTMVEVIVSTILVSTILLVSLTASSGLLRTQSQESTRKEGQLLANFILDEVTALAFRDPQSGSALGPDANETTSARITLDDVDDYHSLVIAPPTDRSGSLLEEFSGWSVSIQVSPAIPTAESFTTTSDVNASLRRIAVTSVSPSGATHAVVGFVANLPMSNDALHSHQRMKQVVLTDQDGNVSRVLQPLRNHPSALSETP